MLNDNISACETKIAPKIVKVPPRTHAHTKSETCFNKKNHATDFEPESNKGLY